MAYPSTIKHERIVDAFVHAFGLIFVAVFSVSLMVGTALYSTSGLFLACIIYSLCLMASFVSSASYHLLPYKDWRAILQRLDHTAIYALIAGTFTPLLVHLNSTWGYVVLCLVWGLAIPAMIYKLTSKDLNPWWSLSSYLVLGWIAILALPQLYERLPISALTAMIVGGLIYTAGTFFYAKKVQIYRYAIWHSFVLVGTISLFSAVWITVFSNTA